MRKLARRGLHDSCPGRAAGGRGGFRILLSTWAVLLVASLGAPRARAGFSDPLRVTDGSGTATQTATGIDLANNAYILSVIDGRIQVKIIGPSLNVDAPIQANGVGQGDPDFATNSRAVTYMSFSQLEERFVGEGREIYLTHNDGGRFLEPTRITANRVDDFASRLVLDRTGEPHLVWARRLGEETYVLYWNRSMAPDDAIVVTKGDYPALFLDSDGIAHVVYSRANDLLYVSDRDGTFGGELRVTTTPFDPESSVSVGVDPQGNVLVSYESKHSLYFATKTPSGGFRPASLLDRGGVLQPKMRVRSEGQVTIVYIKQGDLFYIQGQSSSLNQPQRVFDEPTEAVESHPSVEVDLSNNIHLSYIQNGEVWYTNNAAVPEADFSAFPTIGEVPLKVNFTDLSGGDLQVWKWDFGDGTTSNLRNPSHTYTEPGPYTVTLAVSAPGAVSDERIREEYVFVQDPFNTLRIPDQTVFPGQEGVWFPVLGSHKEPIQAFQLMGLYDPNMLALNRHELEFTVIRALFPEFLVLNDRGTRFELGCIFDFEQPFDKPPLDPGQDQTLLNLVFDVADSAPQGATTQIALVNNRELSDILNIFTVRGRTKVPALTPSNVKILVIEPPFPRFFLRGDANGDGGVDITDAILVLNYLFLGGVKPSCMDAADVKDSGKVDISGAISLLNYLFLGGSHPSVPFPRPGIDPTEDSLPPCE